MPLILQGYDDDSRADNTLSKRYIRKNKATKEHKMIIKLTNV